MKAIIPTGGRGTRMQPLTFSTNKHFIPVGNKPLIFYPIETVAETGIENVLITYNPGWFEAVKSILGDGSRWGLKFKYVLQKQPKGLADIVRSCQEDLEGEAFLFHLGDNIFTDGIKDLCDYFLKVKPNGLLPMVHHSENRRLGVPYFDKKGKLIKYVEKPNDPPHDYAVPGVYFADNNFFKAFKGKDAVKPSARGEWEIPDPFSWMVSHGYKVIVKEYSGKWLDPGKFDDWIYANEYLLKQNISGKAESKVRGKTRISGKVDIGKRCSIVDCVIKGPVAIGDDVVIEKSTIGPYTSISDNCVIKETKLENSVLMKNVTLKNVREPINESVIGAGAEIVSDKNKFLKLFVGEKSQISL